MKSFQCCISGCNKKRTTRKERRTEADFEGGRLFDLDGLVDAGILAGLVVHQVAFGFGLGGSGSAGGGGAEALRQRRRLVVLVAQNVLEAGRFGRRMPVVRVVGVCAHVDA